MTPLFSVALCTHNRADLLQLALESVCEQALARSAYEVLIIDNNSTDHTRQVAKGFESVENVRYIFEPQMGLSHARNRAWKEARGDYVAYLDDDAKGPPQWLTVAKGIVEAQSPAMFGGPSRAFYVSKKPKWFKDEYAQHSFGPTARALGENEFLFGFDLFLRRDVLEMCGGFDPDLGMTGSKMAYGEETAIQHILRERSPDEVIYYDPDVWVYHLAAPDKMVLAKLVRRRLAAGRYYERTFRPDASARTPWLSIGKMSAWLVMQFGSELTYRMLLRPRDKYPHAQSYFYEKALPHLNGFGRMFEQCVENLRRSK